MATKTKANPELVRAGFQRYSDIVRVGNRSTLCKVATKQETIRKEFGIKPLMFYVYETEMQFDGSGRMMTRTPVAKVVAISRVGAQKLLKLHKVPCADLREGGYVGDPETLCGMYLPQ